MVILLSHQSGTHHGTGLHEASTSSIFLSLSLQSLQPEHLDVSRIPNQCGVLSNVATTTRNISGHLH